MAARTARVFLCDACRLPLRICSRCDRGNVYCPACADHRRKEWA